MKTYTIKTNDAEYEYLAKNKKVATLVCLILGKGMYGAKSKGHEIPILFHHSNSWFKEKFKEPLMVAVGKHKKEIKESMMTVKRISDNNEPEVDLVSDAQIFLRTEK